MLWSSREKPSDKFLTLWTYHYREYLTLATAWEQIGILPSLSQLLLPSLNEPRHLVFNPNLGRYTVRFGIRTYYGDLPRRYVNNGVFHNKYELWSHLLYLIRHNSYPNGAVAEYYTFAFLLFSVVGSTFSQIKWHWVQLHVVEKPELLRLLHISWNSEPPITWWSRSGPIAQTQEEYNDRYPY